MDERRSTHRGEGGGITDPAYPARFIHFMEVATKCSHGFRIFETSDDGAVAVVRDPGCGR